MEMYLARVSKGWTFVLPKQIRTGAASRTHKLPLEYGPLVDHI